MTHAYWHAKVSALVDEHKIAQDGMYWLLVAAVMPDELIIAYLEGLTLPGNKRHGTIAPIVKIFENEMAERIILDKKLF